MSITVERILNKGLCHTHTVEATMGALYDALTSLASVHDAELLDGYRRYESLLASVLTPEQLATYAEYIQQSGTVRVFEEMSTDESARLTSEESVIATAIMADETISMENRRVAALLNQRDQHGVAPDLSQSAIYPSAQ